MPRSKYKAIDDYISRIEAHLLKRFPELQFDVAKFGDKEATVLYSPNSEDVYPVIELASEIAIEALIDDGCRIHVRPADEGAWAHPSIDDAGSFPYWTTRNNKTKYQALDDYIAEIERRLLKKYPAMQFEVVKEGDRGQRFTTDLIQKKRSGRSSPLRAASR